MRASLKILMLQLICLTGAIDYQLTLDDNGIFAPCTNIPGNPSNVEGLFDMSFLKVTNDGSKIKVEGKHTVVWKDVQPGDTIKFLGQVNRLEKGTWQKTMFSTSSNNFCKSMFEKNQQWYQFWTQYISNADEIKSKCLNTPGAVFNYAPNYEIELKASLNVPNLEGRYKLAMQFEAFDNRNVKRPVSICSEFRGTLKKL
ncbi:uncharacterized protein LOC108044274 [Drosophila rhopaloa]|uniref:Uncharacterized protein LOC108044274 n=1 Tax=Drosophila rhopaloa TaxID=1041015 RepID=A0A6P4EKI1_DRORH|nr:uncharacterized protein LOC108044274 [Drosophila rhopaloa]